jgi:YD repeat-containing protein
VHVTEEGFLPQMQAFMSRKKSGRSFAVNYAWDAASNVISMTDPQRGDNTYTYDELSRLITVKNPQRDQFTFTYDVLGRRTQFTRPNSVNMTYRYDSVSRINSVIHRVAPTKALLACLMERTTVMMPCGTSYHGQTGSRI